MTEILPPNSCREQPCGLLAVLQQLCFEIEASNLALADCRLAAFQEHTSRLEGLCGHLQRQWDLTSASVGVINRTPDALDQRILNLRNRVTEANYRLSALLRRSRRTVSLLARHYQTMFRGCRAGSECSADLRRWSSEV